MDKELKSKIGKLLEEDKRRKAQKAKVYGGLEFNREVCDVKCRGVKGTVTYEDVTMPKSALVRKKCWDIYKALIKEGKSSQEAKKLILEMSVDEILKWRMGHYEDDRGSDCM